MKQIPNIVSTLTILMFLFTQYNSPKHNSSCAIVFMHTYLSIHTMELHSEPGEGFRSQALCAQSPLAHRAARPSRLDQRRNVHPVAPPKSAIIMNKKMNSML